MTASGIAALVIAGLAFIAAVSYLLYLRLHGRDIDEDDCHLSKNKRVLSEYKAMKERDRKASLKKKRELEKLDREESRLNRKKVHD